MTGRTIALTVLVVLTAAACSKDESPTAPALALSSAKGGGGSGGGGGQTTWIYTAEGDLISPEGVIGSSKGKTPFDKLSLSGFSLILSDAGPSGSIEACRTGTGTYATDFGYYAGQVLTGTLQIKDSTTGMIAFLGNNAEGHTIQFNIGDSTGGVVLNVEDGVYSYIYTDARMYFGGNTTVTDGMYRCVNLNLIATPAS
jgi:hypothetical protein